MLAMILKVQLHISYSYDFDHEHSFLKLFFATEITA